MATNTSNITAAKAVLFGETMEDLNASVATQWFLSNIFNEFRLGTAFLEFDLSLDKSSMASSVLPNSNHRDRRGTAKRIEVKIVEVLDGSGHQHFLETLNSSEKRTTSSKNKKLIYFSLLPTTKLFSIYSGINVNVCLDLSPPMFSLTEFGVPFKLFICAIQQIVLRLSHLVVDSEYVQNCNTSIIALLPGTDLTFCIWHGVISRNSNAKNIGELIFHELSQIEEIVCLSRCDSRYPSTEDLIRSIQEVSRWQPTSFPSKCIVLTCGTLTVGLGESADLAAKGQMSISFLVENLPAVEREPSYFQDLASLTNLANATRGRVESITMDGKSFSQENVLAAVKMACENLLDDDFFYCPLNQQSTYTPINVAASEVLHAYEISGATVEHVVLSRLFGGFHLVSVDEESNDPIRSHALPEDLSLDKITRTVSLQMEKILSGLTVVRFELTYQWSNQHRFKARNLFSLRHSVSAISLSRHAQKSDISRTMSLRALERLAPNLLWTKTLINVEIREISLDTTVGNRSERATLLAQNIKEMDHRLATFLGLPFMPGWIRPELNHMESNSKMRLREHGRLESVRPSCRVLSGFADMIERLIFFDSIITQTLFLCDGRNVLPPISSIFREFASAVLTVNRRMRILMSEYHESFSKNFPDLELIAVSENKMLVPYWHSPAAAEDSGIEIDEITIVVIEILESFGFLTFNVRKLNQMEGGVLHFCRRLLQLGIDCCTNLKYIPRLISEDLSRSLIFAQSNHSSTYCFLQSKSLQYRTDIASPKLISLILADIISAKVCAGFHLVNYDVTDGLASYVLVAMGRQCPSGIDSESLIQCTVESNLNSFICLTYHWPRSCNRTSDGIIAKCMDDTVATLENTQLFVDAWYRRDDELLQRYTKFETIWNYFQNSNKSERIRPVPEYLWDLIVFLSHRSNLKLRSFTGKDLINSAIRAKMMDAVFHCAMPTILISCEIDVPEATMVAVLQEAAVIIFSLVNVESENECFLSVDQFYLQLPFSMLSSGDDDVADVLKPSPDREILKAIQAKEREAILRDISLSLSQAHFATMAGALFLALQQNVEVSDSDFANSTRGVVVRSRVIDLSNMIGRRMEAIKIGHKHAEASLRSAFQATIGSLVQDTPRNKLFIPKFMDDACPQCFIEFSLEFQTSAEMDWESMTLPNSIEFTDRFCKLFDYLDKAGPVRLKIMLLAPRAVSFAISETDELPMACSRYLEDLVAATEKFSAMDTLASLLVMMSSLENSDATNIELAKDCLCSLSGVSRHISKFEFLRTKKKKLSTALDSLVLFEKELQWEQTGFCHFVNSGDYHVSITRKLIFPSKEAPSQTETLPCWVYVSIGTDAEIVTKNVGDISYPAFVLSVLVIFRIIDTDVSNPFSPSNQTEALEKLQLILANAWKRVNQRNLLEELRETQSASPLLIIPEPKKNEKVPRNRPPIPSNLIKVRSEQGNEAGPVFNTENDRRNNNSIMIEQACFQCDRQASVPCPIFAGTNITQEFMIRNLEALALSQFVLSNHNRYFFRQDQAGNIFYMCFDAPTEANPSKNDKERKFVCLGIFGVVPPDSLMIAELSTHLYHRAVEITARNIAINLPRHNLLGSFLQFFKQATPERQVHARFQLPCFVQDPLLFCTIARQYLLHTQLLSGAKYSEKKVVEKSSDEAEELFVSDQVAIWSCSSLKQRFESNNQRETLCQTLTRKNHVSTAEGMSDCKRNEIMTVFLNSEYTFIYNNFQGRPVAPVKGSFNTSNLFKIVGPGLALVEICPFPSASRVSSLTVDVDASFQYLSTFKQVLISAESSKHEVNQIKKFLRSGSKLMVELKHVTDIARDRSETLSELEDDNMIAVTGGESTVDIHVMIYPTVPMQVQNLLDVVQACFQQALMTYTIERINSVPESKPVKESILANKMELTEYQLESLRLVHEIVADVKKAGSQLGHNCCDKLDIVCSLPKKQAMQLQADLVASISKSFPSLSKVTTAFSESAAIVEFEDNARGSKPQWCCLHSSATSVCPNNNCTSIFGKHLFSIPEEATTSNLLREDGSKHLSPVRSQGRSEDLTVINEADIPSFVSKIPWHAERQFFVEFTVDTSGFHVYLFNIASQASAIVQNTCKVLAAAAIESLAKRNADQLKALGINTRLISSVEDKRDGFENRSGVAAFVRDGLSQLCWEQRTLARLNQSIAVLCKKPGRDQNKVHGSSWLYRVPPACFETGYVLECISVPISMSFGPTPRDVFEQIIQWLNKGVEKGDGDMVPLTREKIYAVFPVPREHNVFVASLVLDTKAGAIGVTYRAVNGIELITNSLASLHALMIRGKAQYDALSSSIARSWNDCIPPNFRMAGEGSMNSRCAVAKRFTELLFEVVLKQLIHCLRRMVSCEPNFIYDSIRFLKQYSICSKDVVVASWLVTGICPHETRDFLQVPSLKAVLSTVSSRTFQKIQKLSETILVLSQSNCSPLIAFKYAFMQDEHFVLNRSGDHQSEYSPLAEGFLFLYQSDTESNIVSTAVTFSSEVSHHLDTSFQNSLIFGKSTPRVQESKKYLAPSELIQLELAEKVQEILCAAADFHNVTCAWEMLRGDSVSSQQWKPKLYCRLRRQAFSYDLSLTDFEPLCDANLVALVRRLLENRFGDQSFELNSSCNWPHCTLVLVGNCAALEICFNKKPSFVIVSKDPLEPSEINQSIQEIWTEVLSIFCAAVAKSGC